MSRQDRIAPRTPADLERRYNFDKSFAEVMGIASDARNEAQEAKKVASSIAETDDGLKIKVKALDDEMVTVKAELDMSVKTDEDGNLTSKMHIGADKLTIDTDNFKLNEDGSAEFSGELKAATGTFDGTVRSEDTDMGWAELSDGRVKICTYLGMTDSVYTYKPLIEFTFGGVSKTIAVRIKDPDDITTWDLCIKDSNYFY